MAGGSAALRQSGKLRRDPRRGHDAPSVAQMDGVLAASAGCCVMATFRFHLIGAQPVELDVAAGSIAELGEIVTRQRFVEGRMTQPDGDGVLAGVLLATSRI